MRKLLLFLALLIASPVLGQTNTARMLNGVNAQIGTTYTFVCTDATKLVTFSNASPVTATLFAANDTCSGPGIMFSVKNIGAANVTITPVSGTIDGQASLVLQPGQGADIWNDGVSYTTQGSTSSGPPPAPGFPRLDQVTDQNQSKAFNQGSSAIGFTNGPGMDLSGETSPMLIPLIAGCAATANGQICFDSTGLNFHGFNGTDSILPAFNPSTTTSGDLAGFLLSGGKWTLQDLGPLNGTSGNTIIQASITNIAEGDSLCWDSTASPPTFINCTPGVPPIVSSATSYTFDGTERGEILYFTAAGAKALTLPQASDNSSFNANWFTFIKNDGAGLITITATTSTFFSTGTNTLTISQGIGCSLFSDTSGNGTYYDKCSAVPLTASTNITLTPAAYAIAIAAAGGGGGGTVTGTGTANTVTKWTGASTIGNGCGLDDGTHAVRCDNGYDVNQLGAYLWWAPNNAATGTTVNKMACDDGAGKAIICNHTTSTTNNPLGAAVAANGAAPGTTGSTGICIIGFCSVIMDNGATAGHYAQSSSTVDGDLSDVGTTIPTNGQSYWYVFTGNAGAGTAAVIRNLTPSELNASSVSGGNGKGLQLQVNGTAITKPIGNLVNGTGITFATGTAGNVTTITPTVTASSGMSGMTAGQVPIAATATTVTSSKAIQGTDTNLLSSGTVSGTGTALCTDANGGATTSGCPSSGITQAYQTIDNNGSALTQRSTVNFIPAGSTDVSCVDNSGSSRTDCTFTGGNGPPSPFVNAQTGTTYTVQNADNSARVTFNNSSGTAVTLPQAGQVSSSPFVAIRANDVSSTCTNCSTSSFNQNANDTVFLYFRYQGTATSAVPTDSAGDTWQLLQPCSYQMTGSNESTCTFVAYNVSATGANTVSWVMTGSTALQYSVLEYTGLTIDHQGKSQAVSGPFPSVTLNASNPTEVGIAFADVDAACASSWTQRSSALAGLGFICEKIVNGSSTMTYTATQTNALGTSVIFADYGTTATATFTSGWYAYLENISTAIVTVTPTTSTINGRSTLLIYPNQSCSVMSDGTNYNAICQTIPNINVNGIPGGPGYIYYNRQTAQTSAITDTTMLTVPSTSAEYRFSGTVNCTTTSAAATATLNLKWTDTSNTAQTYTAVATCTTLGSSSINDMVHFIRAKNGTAITYGVTISSTPTFDVAVRLEQ